MNNPLKTLNQLRAEYAYKCIEQVKNKYKNAASRYKSLAKKLPQMITYNGLLTTLAFLKSKAKKEKGQPNAELLLLYHICLGIYRNKENNLFYIQEPLEEEIECRVRYVLRNLFFKATASELFLKTSEALAIAQWLKRIAEGELEDESQ